MLKGNCQVKIILSHRASLHCITCVNIKYFEGVVPKSNGLKIIHVSNVSNYLHLLSKTIKLFTVHKLQSIKHTQKCINTTLQSRFSSSKDALRMTLSFND